MVYGNHGRFDAGSDCQRIAQPECVQRYFSETALRTQSRRYVEDVKCSSVFLRERRQRIQDVLTQNGSFPPEPPLTGKHKAVIADQRCQKQVPETKDGPSVRLPRRPDIRNRNAEEHGRQVEIPPVDPSQNGRQADQGHPAKVQRVPKHPARPSGQPEHDDSRRQQNSAEKPEIRHPQFCAGLEHVQAEPW